MAVRSPLFDIFDPYDQLTAGLLPEADEEIDPIGLIPVKRRPQISDLMPEEEKTSLLRSLANMGASGVTGLGWILDTPGAMARGLLSGGPTKAFSALWENSDDRVTGRELLRQYGMVGDEDNWGNFAGGIAAEFLTDPLTIVNPLAILGRGAYTSAGRALQRSGVLDNAALVARRNDMGVREMLRRPAREILDMSGDPEAYRKFSDAARGKRLDAEALLNRPAASLFEVRVPGTERGVALGTGAFGNRVARGLDDFGESLTTNPYTAPVVNRVTAAFDPTVMGEIDPARQWRNREAWDESLRNERDLLEWVTQRQRAANKVGEFNGFTFNSPRIQAAIRDTIEAKMDPERVAQLIDQEAVSALDAVPEWRAWRDDVADRLSQSQERRRQFGLESPTARSTEDTGFFPSQSVWFNNPEAPNLPNRIGRRQRQYDTGRRVLNLDDVVGFARDPKTDIERRSETFRRLMGGDFGRQLQDRMVAADDVALPGILDEAFAALGLEAPFSKLTVRYDGDLTDLRGFDDALADTTISASQRRELERARQQLVDRQAALKVQLGDTLRQADRQFSSANMGLFDQSTVNDVVRYGLGQARSEANARVIIDDLLANASPLPANAVPGGGQLNLLEAAEGIGFNRSDLAEVLRGRLGEGVDVGALSVNERVIENLKRLSPARARQERGSLGKLWDTYTNAFKIGALANPAYHTRNLYSGYLSTLMSGNANPVTSALDWYAGRQAGMGNYTERGLFGLMPSLADRLQQAPRYAGMGRDEAVDLFLQEAARNRLGGGLVDEAEGVVEQAAKGLYPGADASDPVRYFGQDGLLYDPSRTWRDWLTVRGVDWGGVLSDRPAPARTTNPLLQMHERVGKQVEDANRYGTYLTQLRAGASPDAAARQVFRTQVDYSPRAFTDFERQLKRLVPFYSYTRGIAPSVVENLLYRPGGLQSNTVRAISRASAPSEDSFVPEYLRQSAAIPLPGAPAENLQRFLTNIDLPYEGLVNLFSPGIGNTGTQRLVDAGQKTGMNLLGMLNPLIKAPLEMVLNRQLYTGRELSDLYSSWESAVSREYGPLARSAEQVFVNLPGGSRINSIVRTAADSRLSTAERAQKLLINNLLGVKVTDVDQERTKRLAARETLDDLLSTTPGVRTYENITVPEDVLRSMPREQQQMYLLYKVIQSEAAKRARDKKKAQTALDPLQVLGVIQ